ncbi:hypothetical protein [Burkholderia thailandensis]|uniref:hypothetical protein n=1 Tax=Burkholderia thailandensis TaxID=57975 RepID=UPI00075BB794|nr:hypothetical protein [Burkholderia thailandensis]KVG14172.1 hypothetical protein WJ25_00010 [Burkholderia thailandensis]
MTMSQNINTSGLSTAPNEIDQDSLIAALDALQPNARQQKEDHFRRALPSILAAEKRGVPRSTIVRALKEQGLSLSVGGYKALYDKVTRDVPEGGKNG